ncbi:hypothetical protein ILT44_21045 [Microvirga sp. BT689]|uniref:hypothetical protein n=1 Tax=Microvirga arvi TaxID=2778731 RepID=UPI00195192E7|nr:hypothetical protein [Microvirga arvi]MBM6582695.1 hypothetical protein [Microvirga arvi]
MKLYRPSSPRTAVTSVLCIDPDGQEYRHFLTFREFRMLSKAKIIWNGAPTTLSFRQCHEGVPINPAATALAQTAGAGDELGLSNALPLRGPVFVGGDTCWFKNFDANGTDNDVQTIIDTVSLQGEVRVSFLGWDLTRKFTPVSCVSCQSTADYLLLKIMLA